MRRSGAQLFDRGPVRVTSTSAAHVRGTPLDAQGADAFVQRSTAFSGARARSMTQRDDRQCYRAGLALPGPAIQDVDHVPLDRRLRRQLALAEFLA